MSAQRQTSMRTRLLYFSAIGVILIVFALTLYSCWPRQLPDLLVTPTPIALVELNPQITLDPAQGFAGTPVQVTGAGWQPDRTVLLVLEDAQGRSDLLTASTVDPKGRFVARFSYPINQRWLTPGPHRILAYIADTTMQSMADFVVLPPTAMGTATAIIITPIVQPSPTVPATPTPAPVIPTTTPLPASATPQPTVVVIQNWRGDYWNNPDLIGAPVLIRDDSNINFDWGFGSPDPTIGRDNFSARWSRTLDFVQGLYRFTLEIDDGARLFLDDQLVIDEWRDGAQRTVAFEQGLGAGMHRLRLEYYERSGLAVASLRWERRTDFLGWRGSYYANTNLQGDPALVRDDPAIDFAWGTGAPAPGLPADHFSVRWERRVNFLAGRYRFQTTVDDGIRVWLDNNLLLDEWHDTAEQTYTAELALTNRTYNVRVEYYENTQRARVRLNWDLLVVATTAPTPTSTPRLTPTATWTPLATPLLTNAPTATWTPLVTPLPVSSMTPTWTPLPTATSTASQTATVTATAIATITETSTLTSTPTPTASATQTPTATVTLTSTVAITLTSTATLAATSSPTPTATPTLTTLPTITVTLTATVTVTPTLTVTTTAFLWTPAMADVQENLQYSLHLNETTIVWPLRPLYRKEEPLTMMGVKM